MNNKKRLGEVALSCGVIGEISFSPRGKWMMRVENAPTGRAPVLHAKDAFEMLDAITGMALAINKAGRRAVDGDE